MSRGNIELYIVTLLQSIAIIMQTYEVLTYWFQMELKMKFVSIATMIALTVVAVWRVSLFGSKGISILFRFFVFDSIFCLWCSRSFLFFKEKEIKHKIKVQLFRWKMLITK